MARDRAKWDTAKGWMLYEQDQSFAEIARVCRVSKSAVAHFADRNWPKRAVDAARRARFRPPGPALVKPPSRAQRAIKSTLPLLPSLQPE